MGTFFPRKEKIEMDGESSEASTQLSLECSWSLREQDSGWRPLSGQHETKCLGEEIATYVGKRDGYP